MTGQWNPSSRIFFGGDYNPEQWDAATRRDDIELMRAAGVTMTTIGVFSWATLEPRPGEIDLTFLRTLIDDLAVAGIDVCLATPSASAPRWFFHAHPDALAMTSNGLRRSTGSRTNHCPSSPELRDASRRLASVLGAEFGSHPSVRLWHVGNEYGSQGCWCDRCGAEFRDFVRARYGTLDAVNEAWGTVVWSMSFSDWSEIGAPGDTVDFQSPGLMLDWKRFISRQQLENYLGEKAELEKAGAVAPITTNFMGLYRGLNYAEWAPHCSPIANDSYPDPGEPQGAREQAFTSDLMRSLGGGEPFIQMEQVTSAVQWRARNATKRPGQFALWSIQTVARGADAVCQFQWRQSPFGPEQLHGAMVPHSGTGTRVWKEVVALGADLGRLDALAGQRLTASVAIHVDWEAIWAQDLVPGLTDQDPAEALRAWHATFFERGVLVDFVFTGQDWSAYDLVVMPAAFALSTASGRRVGEYVASGGTVIAGPLTGVVDEHGRANLGGYVASSAPVFGLRVREHHSLPLLASPAQSWESVSGAVTVEASEAHAEFPGRGDHAIAPGPLVFTGLIEDTESTGAEVVAVFSDGDLAGRPAITRADVGGGAAWYVAGELEPASRATLVAHVLSGLRIDETLADAGPGIEVIQRGDHTFVLNHSDDAKTVKVPAGRDPLTGEQVDGAVSVGGRSFRIVRV